MKFAKKPENDFASFIRIYYDECRSRFDKIEAIAGKWMYRDLIPGMSDFDTRFICRDDMTADDWCDMSVAVGKAHLYLCKKYPCWARMLEHTPGINLTWSELASETCYYPEFRQWTFYHTEQPQKLASALKILGERPWDIKDEYYFLKRFCLYYGRYDRQIDPGCNLFPHENKYPMHSRLMHYFAPPVQSAVCILEKKVITGKFDAFEIAERCMHELDCWDVVRELFHADYEIPQWYAEPRLSQLEDILEQALAQIARRLREVATLIPTEAGIDIPAWKKSLKEAAVDRSIDIFYAVAFSRLVKGRLRFYLQCPWYFESLWCIENELKRFGNLFFRVPFRVFWKLKTGKTVDDPSTILDELKGDPLTEVEVAAAKEFARLTPGHWEKGKERETALAIADFFDDFYRGLHKIGEQAPKIPSNNVDNSKLK